MPGPNDPASVFDHIDMKSRSECWPWRGGGWGGRDRNKRPYYQTNGTRWIAYRLVYYLVRGVKPTDEQIILHSCDNGQYPIGCCNPDHMSIGNEAMNARDMMERERHGLPRSVIKAIRRLLDAGRTHAEIAELYGVSRQTVTELHRGRTYVHIEEDNSDPVQQADNG